jgi:hypothetical protein
MIKKGRPNYLHFIDLEGRVSSAYVPVRDQNLVVRGLKKWRLIGCMFFISFWKGFKIKAKWQKEFVCVFYIERKWWLKIWLKLIWYLIKKENKNNDHLIFVKVYYENIFFYFWLFECFCFFEYWMDIK